MRYKNFDIKIILTGEDYFVTATSAEGESAQSVMNFEPDFKTALNLASSGKLKGEEIKQFGSQLHALLFSDGIGSLFARSFTKKGNKTRTRLRFCIESHKISNIPWEFLHHESFLSTSDRTPLLRYIDSGEPIRKLKIELPLKGLVIIAETLQFDHQRRLSLLRSFQEIQRTAPVEFSFLEGRATRQAIAEKLSGDSYHLLHLITGGGCNADVDHLLLDALDGCEKLAADEFGELLQPCQSLKLILLDCVPDSESNPLSVARVAHRLVRSGIPAVIATQMPMAEAASMEFAKEFYQGISSGDEAGRADLAANQSRRQVLDHAESSADFAAPVLFTSAPNAVIFYYDHKKPSVFSLARLKMLAAKIWPFARKRYSRGVRLALLRDVRTAHQRNVVLLKEKAEQTDEPLKTRLQNQIKNELVKLIEIEDRLWPWGKTLLAAFVFSLILGFGSEVNFLNQFFSVDDRLTHWLIDYENQRRQPRIDNRQLALVMIESPPNDGEDKIAETRNRMIDLLTTLQKAGARVAAFDYELLTESKSDEKLRAKITEVATANPPLKVVVAATELKKCDEPQTPSPVLLREVLRDKYGLVDLATSGDVARKGGLGRFVEKEDPDLLAERIAICPSLALKAVSQFVTDSKGKVFYEFLDGEVRVGDDRPGSGDIRVPAESPLEDVQLKRSLIHIEYVTKDSIESSELQNSALTRLGDEALQSRFKDRIVVIGINDEKDTVNVPNNESRKGVHVVANLIWNLLNGRESGRFIRRLWSFYRYLLIVLMILIALLLQARFARVLRQNVSFNVPYLKDAVQIPLILCLIGGLYLLVVGAVYEHYLIIFDITYPLGALVLTYVSFAFARRAINRKWS